MSPLKIYIEDVMFAHCKYSSNALYIPNDVAPIEWVRTSNYTNDDLVVWTESSFLKRQARSEESKNIAWIVESPAAIPDETNWILENGDKFNSIWTHDERVLKKWDHAILLPIGGCWLRDEEKKIYDKTKDFSIIASGKAYLPGHILRHNIIAGVGKNIDVWGSAQGPLLHLISKIHGLKEYRYHFAIENCISGYYFSEKLVDAFMTGCIPIYWGTQYIDQFFNIDGMIIFNELKELPELLKRCTPEFYESKKSIIEENYNLAKNYRLAEDKIPSLLK
jgi:hypothetical protein